MKKFLTALFIIFLTSSSFAQWINKPPAGYQIKFSHSDAQDLVGAWVFNEGSGPTVHDLSGSNFDGTLTAMVPLDDWVIAQTGYAIDFNGADDRIDFGDVLDFDGTSPFSARIIFKWLSINFQFLFGKQLNSGNFHTECCWKFYIWRRYNCFVHKTFRSIRFRN